jgi:hypothetical protein
MLQTQSYYKGKIFGLLRQVLPHLASPRLDLHLPRPRPRSVLDTTQLVAVPGAVTRHQRERCAPRSRSRNLSARPGNLMNGAHPDSPATEPRSHITAAARCLLHRHRGSPGLARLPSCQVAARLRLSHRHSLPPRPASESRMAVPHRPASRMDLSTNKTQSVYASPDGGPECRPSASASLSVS